MQMVYNSDSYVVVQFDAEAAAPPADEAPAPQPLPDTPAARGFEIVDKHGRAEVFLRGAVAEQFRLGAQALMQQAQGAPNVEALDDYIAGFAALGRQPLAVH
jgi:hypothetical protein